MLRTLRSLTILSMRTTDDLEPVFILPEPPFDWWEESPLPSVGPNLQGSKTFCTLLANVDLDKNLTQLATTPSPDAGHATNSYADAVAEVLAHRPPRPELADAIATMESYARAHC